MNYNTITREQYKWLWNRLYDYCEATGAPDFWTLDTLDVNGEQCAEEKAAYAQIEIQDFDNKHDKDFLYALFSELGICIDESKMLDGIDLARMEQEEEPRPLLAALVYGDGILGPVYSYELIFCEGGESLAFAALARERGTSSACGELNDRIAQRMREENENFDDLEAAEKDFLWAEYVERYTGRAADELLADFLP